MVLPGNAAKGIPVHLLVPLIPEEADDVHGDLEELHDHVDEDTIKAGVAETNRLLMVLQERIHGGPPGVVWVTPPSWRGPPPLAATICSGISRGSAPCLESIREGPKGSGRRARPALRGGGGGECRACLLHARCAPAQGGGGLVPRRVTVRRASVPACSGGDRA